MERRTPDFARVFAGATPLEATEIDALFELAFLMAHANGDASPDELGALRALIKHLRPAANIGELFESYADSMEGGTPISERALAAGAKLTRELARELAYKAVYAVAVYDLETNQEERELEELVIRALRLDDKRAHELGLETNEALVA